MKPEYDRDVFVQVLIFHQPTHTSGCHCGWGQLGRSHASHVADVYEEAMAWKAERARADEAERRPYL